MKYAQGVVIYFDDGITSGKGRIVGIASPDQAVIGSQYIIEQLEGKPAIPSKDYPYSHRVVSEIHIKVRDE